MRPDQETFVAALDTYMMLGVIRVRKEMGRNGFHVKPATAKAVLTLGVENCGVGTSARSAKARGI